MLSDTQNKRPFVGTVEMLPSKRLKMLDEKEIVKTIYYEEHNMEISYE